MWGMRRRPSRGSSAAATLVGTAFCIHAAQSVHVSDFFRLPPDAVVEIGRRRFNLSRGPALTHKTTLDVIALTGATGFIVNTCWQESRGAATAFRALLRRACFRCRCRLSAVIGDLTSSNMSAALEGWMRSSTRPGLAHAMSGIPEDDYRLHSITEATVRLARAARRAGAKRFVFLSSTRSVRTRQPTRS